MEDVRQSIPRTMLNIAESLCQDRSVCPGGKTGCVIADSSGVILAMGYNGPMRGECDDMQECMRDKLGLHGGKSYNICPCVHAEANAIAHAARHGVSLKGGTAYITRMPCGNCARMLHQAGVEYYCTYSNNHRHSETWRTNERANEARNKALKVAIREQKQLNSTLDASQ